MAFEVTLPDIGEGLTEAEVVQWLVEPGDLVAANQPLVEVETDKAVVEIPSIRAGVILHVGAPAGTLINVGDLLVVIGDEGETWEATAPAPEKAAEPAPAGSLGAEPASQDEPKAVPLVRKLAREKGVDLATLVGSGAAGQITREDVIAATAIGSAAAPARDVTQGETLSKLRRTIAEHMTRSWEEIPHVTVWGPAEATRFLEAKRATGVSIDALLVTAVLPALAEFPVFSANFDGGRLAVRTTYDIGIAVNTEAGLMVPVVRDAGTVSLEMLDKEVARLAAGAHSRTLGADDLRGQSFTITNVGAVGGGYGTPIIPHGTTAILSVGRARDEVVARYGQPVVAPMLPLAVSFDHRIIDGATGTRFLNRLIENIELFH